jgi:hypothetical protein
LLTQTVPSTPRIPQGLWPVLTRAAAYAGGFGEGDFPLLAEPPPSSAPPQAVSSRRKDPSQTADRRMGVIYY